MVTLVLGAGLLPGPAQGVGYDLDISAWHGGQIIYGTIFITLYYIIPSHLVSQRRYTGDLAAKEFQLKESLLCPWPLGLQNALPLEVKWATLLAFCKDLNT